MTPCAPSLTLYLILNAAFCVIVVVSNFISAKLFYLPGFESFMIPAGLITYPLTFLLSDLITELYGSQKAKLTVYIALSMTLVSYVIIQVALYLPSADLSNQHVLQATFGLNGLIIFASLTAYLIAQLLDIALYTWIKSYTGSKLLWLRNNGSTLISQIADTVTVNTIHLYWGLGMEASAVFPIMIFSYSYKALFSLLNTPLFYLCVFLAQFDWKQRKRRFLSPL